MLLYLMLLVFCQRIFAGPLHKPVYDTNDFEAIGRHFENFLRTHNKIYDGLEKIQRFLNFFANIKKINELNSIYEDTTFDINHLTDWSEEELKSLRGLRMPADGEDGVCKVEGDPRSEDAPEALDWRERGAVSAVKNQRNCGSCWAFSTTALVESKYLQKRKHVVLSEQQLMDCDPLDGGCNKGGLVSTALTYLIKSGGQETEETYPYENQNDTCKFDKSRVAARILNCTDFNLTSEEALKELLFKEGPLAIGVSALNWSFYRSGVWGHCNVRYLDHAVLLVGYGLENGKKFWLIKNSWGPGFGEDGFIRIKRGIQCNGIGGIGVSDHVPAVTTATVA